MSPSTGSDALTLDERELQVLPECRPGRGAGPGACPGAGPGPGPGPEPGVDPGPGAVPRPAPGAAADAGAPPGAAPALSALSGLLRGLGALLIVAAFLLYLFRGWRDGDDLTRYTLLLANTGVLTLAGFALGHLVREAKGARLFIALALAAVPVNFAFLGALTYGHLTWDALQGGGSGPWDWPFATGAGAVPGVVPDGGMGPGMALPLAGAAAVGLALAVWVGFLAMARRSAPALAGLYLLANAALLVPTRSDGPIAALLIGLGLALAVGAVRLRRRDPTLAAPGGVFARAVLVLPLLVLAGRSLWLYAPDTLFHSALCLACYLGLRQALGAPGIGGGARAALLEGAAALVAAAAAVLACLALVEAAAVPRALALPLGGGLLAGLLADLSTRAAGRARRCRALAAAVLALTMGLNLVLVGGLGAALACVVAGLGTLVYGYVARGRWLFALGAMVALGGLGAAAQDALARFTVAGWMGLVLLGVATVVAGSVLERQGAALGGALGRCRRHFDPPA